MRFLKRHQFPLLFAVITVFCSVLVLRQYLVNQSEHVDLREDFILLHNQGRTKAATRLYQMLIQELSREPDRLLLADEQRFELILAQTNLPPSDLLWKYRVSVQNELRSRVRERIARALKRAAPK